jgi:hypothetical protein
VQARNVDSRRISDSPEIALGLPVKGNSRSGPADFGNRERMFYFRPAAAYNRVTIVETPGVAASGFLLFAAT